ncbi:MAG TPA: hypothetical protein VI583_17460 [Cyclobacteriaceae bacterium]|nr:hypothetical protein [Cyclobacteriaceae bacterium]
MSVKKALRFYEGLSKDQQKLINEKQIGTTLSLKEWIVFLKNTAAYDEIGDLARKKNVTKIALSVIGIIASIFIMFLEPLAGILLIVIAVLVMAEAIRVNSKLIRLDLSNHLRIFLMPLLFVLKDKAGEKARLSLSLDLRNPKNLNPSKKYKESDTDIKLFEPKYIIGKIKLLDETGMEFIISDEIRSLRIVRRTSSRTKIKHKNKVSQYYFIRLTFPKKYYMAKNGIAGQARMEETLDSIICKLKAKTKTDHIEEIISVEQFLNSVQELYGLVQSKPEFHPPDPVFHGKPVEAQPAAATATPVLDDSSALIPFMVWGGTYFTTSDYSGFNRQTGNFSENPDQDSFSDS